MIQRESPETSTLLTPSCVLMFSGGRDSTLAALRLADAGVAPALVTITSNHLVGIASVHTRLRELKGQLPDTTRWLQIQQPVDLATDISFYEQTCLPCHHAYVVLAATVAASLEAKTLAFGYTGYQSDWPEQTPLAIASLTRVLAENGIDLSLPVFNLPSREAALVELEARGLSSASLEQKCSRQVTNVKLDDDRLQSQVALWETAIRASMNKLDSIPTHILSDTTLGEIEK